MAGVGLLNKPKDITGQRFGKLVAISPTSQRSDNGSVIWECHCDCGNDVLVPLNDLRRKAKQSCGCLAKKHGLSKSKIYKVWCSMKARCNNPHGESYKNYGSRGITICDRWNGPDGFKNFYADMGEAPRGMSLDRIDNDKGYSPENCRWATRKQQQNNTRSNRYITMNGQTKTIHEWCDEYGIDYETVRRRIDTYHWTEQEAITTPVYGKYHAGGGAL